MRQSQSRASSVLIFTKAGQKSSSLSLSCQLIQHAPFFPSYVRIVLSAALCVKKSSAMQQHTP